MHAIQYPMRKGVLRCIIAQMAAQAWTNKYKKRVAREFVREADFQPSDEPSGIFLAGLPGAGKTEFSQELIKNIESPPLRLDMDEIATLMEGYRPEIADTFRGVASAV